MKKENHDHKAVVTQPYWNEKMKEAIREVLLEQEVIDALAAAICKSPENFWNKPVSNYGIDFSEMNAALEKMDQKLAAQKKKHEDD